VTSCLSEPDSSHDDRHQSILATLSALALASIMICGSKLNLHRPRSAERHKPSSPHAQPDHCSSPRRTRSTRRSAAR
jgi:hypothetical protein